jgi:cyclic beta-1,2-glucan synthetase
LAGHLIAIAAACNEWAEAPSVYLQGDFDGLLDTVGILEESLRVVPDDRRQMRPLRQRLSDRIDGMRRAVETVKSEPEWLRSAPSISPSWWRDRKLADLIHHEVGSVQTEQLAEWAAALHKTAEAHVADSHSDKGRVDELRRRLQAIATRARKLPGDGFLLPAQQGAQAAVDRLPRRGAPA